jgi:hypothetical protein
MLTTKIDTLFKIKAFFAMILTSVGLILINIYDLNFGLDTIWDEGTYIQWLKTENNFICVTQSFNFLNKIGFKNNIDIIQLRIFRIIIQLITIFSFAFFSIIWLKKYYKIQKHKLTYFSLLLLISVLSLEILSKTICFRHFQQFFSLFGLLTFLFFLHEKIKIKRIIYLIISSISICICLINVPPSGLILMVIWGIFIVINEKSSIKETLFYLLIYCGSILLTLMLIHFVLVDFTALIPEILSKSKMRALAESGHSLSDILRPYIGFFKLMYHKILKALAFILIYLLIQKYIKSNYVSILFFCISVAVLFSITPRYLRIYGVFNLLLPIVFLITKNIFHSVKNRSSNSPKYYKNSDIALLFVFPLAACLGTNAGISVMILFFIPSWALLLCILLHRYSNFISNIELSLLLLFTTFIVINLHYFYFYRHNALYLGNFYKSNCKIESLKPIKNIYIREEQKNYFIKIDSILKAYNFIPNSDYMLSFSGDLITIHVFSGKLTGFPYVNAKSFAAGSEKHQMPKPQFLFLDSLSYNIVSKNNSWNFPIDYDRIYLGNPEIFKGKNSQARWIFCERKKLSVHKN